VAVHAEFERTAAAHFEALEVMVGGIGEPMSRRPDAQADVAREIAVPVHADFTAPDRPPRRRGRTHLVGRDAVDRDCGAHEGAQREQ
jgi:hypothetical protein